MVNLRLSLHTSPGTHEEKTKEMRNREIFGMGMTYHDAGSRDAIRAQSKPDDGHDVVVRADREERS